MDVPEEIRTIGTCMKAIERCVWELKGDETGMVDYKAMHYSLDNGQSLKDFNKKPTCLDFCFKKIILKNLCGKFT